MIFPTKIALQLKPMVTGRKISKNIDICFTLQNAANLCLFNHYCLSLPHPFVLEQNQVLCDSFPVTVIPRVWREVMYPRHRMCDSRKHTNRVRIAQ